MFGYGYQEVRDDVLEVGNYNAKIVNVEVKKYNNGNEFVMLTFNIQGHSPDCKPNTMVINDRPKKGEIKASGSPVDDKDLAKWDKSMTRFFDCFGIAKGDFNFKNWLGKNGEVSCNWQYDASEQDKKSKKFKEFTPVANKNSNNGGASVNNAANNADSIEDNPNSYAIY